MNPNRITSDLKSEVYLKLSKKNPYYSSLISGCINKKENPRLIKTNQYIPSLLSTLDSKEFIHTVTVCLLPFAFCLLPFALIKPALAQPKPSPLKVVVNSNQDGSVKPDNNLTLREAINLINGTLTLDQLSPTEKAQVESLSSPARSKIEFNLPGQQTTIRLVEHLPPIATAGVIVDGTTQPGYNRDQSATAEIEIPIPLVAITPAETVEIFQGLTIINDDVIIKGLSIYGFNGEHQATVISTPADILISHRLPPDYDSKFYKSQFAADKPPQSVIIENTWLGIPPDESMPSTMSAFGVWVFNGTGVTIRRNRIAYHDGSGIITSKQARDLTITENIIVGNGMAGMPDAIRLDGTIDNTTIDSNLICGNDGSAVYLFKPMGAVSIRNNQIKYNGHRLRRAAIYLMGDDHQVIGNQITHQAGPGVVVAAYPESDRNIIQDNQFAALEGLSIDLVTRNHTGARHYQVGDGPNPKRDSPNRRRDTGNNAVNTPRWLAVEFFQRDGQVSLDGLADPGSEVDIYVVDQVSPKTPGYGALSKKIATAEADQEGKFGISLSNVQPGDYLSAIATHPDYGTSEPAVTVVVRSLDDPGNSIETRSATTLPNTAKPQCTSRPVARVPVQPQSPQIPEPILFSYQSLPR
ncbi:MULTISPECIES: right-handed parallel beta-helix repeat-containing protein [unclassified Moorena]|uniref:right-handed parallel beta-helix repeat-containing protein n=1 Tax=unclassified Moorena TaxID=2683338 RepID=UPI0013B94C07|nr:MULTISPECIES: right-handed parallel beta-helix repeat-containing protein [unclassified Moorena]NEP31860.1 right-handed parallel beta-helix repeat-containing protein [Moorena sp. SIO3B2]NEQ08023.1 right-handed parallel beta-helix repeat-containing protein [Moorena sp. SIO4E2]